MVIEKRKTTGKAKTIKVKFSVKKASAKKTTSKKKKMNNGFEIFLDTNLLIDYIENRNRDYVNFISELLENKKVIVS